MNTLLETTFSLSPHSDVELSLGWTMSDLCYVDHVLLLSEDPDSLEDLSCSLSKAVSKLGTRFAPPKCKVMLQDWVGPTPY